ncbi:jg5009 [Pararge aegeria aegeria]|uniref:Jg5009 protein n=1 Tax=Pararge aegeria aegeria TaxID=348720 RepID=A0A8S4S482_9NEOP|nr:jg5009 [Pararge aegeria aegeria]
MLARLTFSPSCLAPPRWRRSPPEVPLSQLLSIRCAFYGPEAGRYVGRGPRGTEWSRVGRRGVATSLDTDSLQFI